MPIHFGRRQQQQLAGWMAGWLAGWLDGWLVDWQANNRDQTHLKCRAKGERQNAHLNFMDELQQMEHCAACQKLLPKSVGCQNALPKIPGCEAEPIPDARRWWWRAIYAMIMTTRARTGGAVGRVDDPSSCPLDAHYSQLKLMQRPAVLSPVRSSRSLSLSLSSSLSLSLISLSLSHCCCPSALFFVLSRDSFFLKR